MKDQFDIVIRKDGSVETVYQDGLADTLGAKTEQVTRASNVEWEEGKGWTVRSSVDPDVAIRGTQEGKAPHLFVARYGMLVYFKERELALAEEVRLFWHFAAMLRPECTIEGDIYCFKHHCGADDLHCMKPGCPHCETARRIQR